MALVDCSRKTAVRGGIIPFVLLALVTNASGQPPTDAPRSTILNVELLSGNDGGGLHAQSWGKVFESMDVSLIIRRGLGDDKPELTEKTVGTLRYVTIVGRLTRSGSVQFPGKEFDRSQARALKEWLDELRTYGVQGAPDGQPLWGLSKKQFEELFAALSIVTDAEVLGATLPEAIDRLKLPSRYPLRWSTPAEEAYRSRTADRLVRQPVQGFTVATALAIMLNDAGFGFRPNRTPGGTLELVVEVATDDPLDRWPVGWPLQQQAPVALPGMFAMTNVSVVGQPAAVVLTAAAKATNTPIVIDHAALRRAGVDLDALRLDYPIKRTTWSLALRYMLVPEKLNREYLQDEAGRAFVWITTIGKTRRPEEPTK